MKVVLDTDTLVSAMVFNRERWAWLRAAWKDGTVVPLLCAETAKELLRVLAYPKFRLTDIEQKALIEEIIPYCETVAKVSTEGLEPCRDPNDQIFLCLAHSGHAQVLVTGDDDLLSYPGTVSFQILPASSLRTLIESQ